MDRKSKLSWTSSIPKLLLNNVTRGLCKVTHPLPANWPLMHLSIKHCPRYNLNLINKHKAVQAHHLKANNWCQRTTALCTEWMNGWKWTQRTPRWVPPWFLGQALGATRWWANGWSLHSGMEPEQFRAFLFPIKAEQRSGDGDCLAHAWRAIGRVRVFYSDDERRVQVWKTAGLKEKGGELVERRCGRQIKLNNQSTSADRAAPTGECPPLRSVLFYIYVFFSVCQFIYKNKMSLIFVPLLVLLVYRIESSERRPGLLLWLKRFKKNRFLVTFMTKEWNYEVCVDSKNFMDVMQIVLKTEI